MLRDPEQELHGMFDQVDHAKVLRNDTQESRARIVYEGLGFRV